MTPTIEGAAHDVLERSAPALDPHARPPRRVSTGCTGGRLRVTPRGMSRDETSSASHSTNDASEAAAAAASHTLLGRVVLLVRDYDEALAFYRAALGAEPIFDQTTPQGQRYLHVALPAQPTPADQPQQRVALWFLQVSDEATGTAAPLQTERTPVGRQAGPHPFLVLYTRDCAAAVERFVGAGGEVRRELREEGGARFAHVADLYGNELVIVELGNVELGNVELS